MCFDALTVWAKNPKAMRDVECIILQNAIKQQWFSDSVDKKKCLRKGRWLSTHLLPHHVPKRQRRAGQFLSSDALHVSAKSEKWYSDKADFCNDGEHTPGVTSETARAATDKRDTSVCSAPISYTLKVVSSSLDEELSKVFSEIYIKRNMLSLVHSSWV